MLINKARQLPTELKRPSFLLYITIYADLLTKKAFFFHDKTTESHLFLLHLFKTCCFNLFICAEHKDTTMFNFDLISGNYGP